MGSRGPSLGPFFGGVVAGVLGSLLIAMIGSFWLAPSREGHLASLLSGFLAGLGGTAGIMLVNWAIDQWDSLKGH